MDNATIQLPMDLVQGAITNQVAEAMTRALGGHDQIISKLVGKMLSAKVDREGKDCGYGDLSFIQWCLNDVLRKAIKKALEEELVNHEKDIHDAIVNDLKKRNSPLVKQLVSAMTTGITNAAKNSWSLTVEVRSPNN